MDNVTIRDLRNHGGDVIKRVMAGERLIVTRAGQPVAELRPLPSDGTDVRALLERWSHLPIVDEEAFRRDVDDVLDSSL